MTEWARWLIESQLDYEILLQLPDVNAFYIFVHIHWYQNKKKTHPLILIFQWPNLLTKYICILLWKHRIWNESSISIYSGVFKEPSKSYVTTLPRKIKINNFLSYIQYTTTISTLFVSTTRKQDLYASQFATLFFWQ